MDRETSESILEIDAAIMEAEAKYAQTGRLYDAETALSALRKKYFGELFLLFFNKTACFIEAWLRGIKKKSNKEISFKKIL